MKNEELWCNHYLCVMLNVVLPPDNGGGKRE